MTKKEWQTNKGIAKTKERNCKQKEWQTIKGNAKKGINNSKGLA